MVTNWNRSSSRHGSKGVPVNINTCEQNGQKQNIWCKLDFNFMTVWFHTNSSCPWNYPWFVSLGFFPRFLFMFFFPKTLAPAARWKRCSSQKASSISRAPSASACHDMGRDYTWNCWSNWATCIVNHIWTWMNMIYCWTCGFSYTWFTEENKNMFLQLVVFYWGFSSKSFGKVQRWGPREANSQHWVISLMMI